MTTTGFAHLAIDDAERSRLLGNTNPYARSERAAGFSE